MEPWPTADARARATYLIYRGLGTAMQRLPEPVVEAAATAVEAVASTAEVADGVNIAI